MDKRPSNRDRFRKVDLDGIREIEESIKIKRERGKKERKKKKKEEKKRRKISGVYLQTYFPSVNNRPYNNHNKQQYTYRPQQRGGNKPTNKAYCYRIYIILQRISHVTLCISHQIFVMVQIYIGIQYEFNTSACDGRPIATVDLQSSIHIALAVSARWPEI